MNADDPLFFSISQERLMNEYLMLTCVIGVYDDCVVLPTPRSCDWNDRRQAISFEAN
jgi:hypothetical protein